MLEAFALVAYGIGVGFFAQPGFSVVQEGDAHGFARWFDYACVLVISFCWPISTIFYLRWLRRERRKTA